MARKKMVLPGYACYSKHNTSKGRVLLACHLAKEYGVGLVTCEQLANKTGVPRHYLGCRLPLWVQWDYLYRVPANIDGKLGWKYGLTKRGREFLETRTGQRVFNSMLKYVKPRRFNEVRPVEQFTAPRYEIE